MYFRCICSSEQGYYNVQRAVSTTWMMNQGAFAGLSNDNSRIKINSFFSSGLCVSQTISYLLIKIYEPLGFLQWTVHHASDSKEIRLFDSFNYTE